VPRASVQLVAVAVALAPALARADAAPEPVRARALRRDEPIAIDGRLDEPIWQRAPKHAGFVQRFPKDGAKPDHDTRFAIAYDDDAIYVAVWCDDAEPKLIRPLLTRRDVDSPSDAVLVGFDSYHDRRTAYVFQVNAANVQRDFLIFDDTNVDDTWDAVWTSAVAIGDAGWTAELRIPLGQLRFRSADAPQWGVQVSRVVARTQEQSTWSPWPRASPQIVSKFGVLGGIDRLKPRRRLELLPYALGGFDAKTVDPGDPLNKPLSGRGNVGLDLKYGLGPAFTLSATINPDFGQVEADPSVVNLSPNEIYYVEKRPFFLEGMDLFRLPVGNGDNQQEGAFYSRRIGAAPPNEPTSYNYIDWPTATTIYGAAKLTGKTPSGWSVGVLEAVTGPADASIVDTNNVRVAEHVAPLASYTVARIKHDFNEARSAIGVSATAVERRLDDSLLVDTLAAQAYTAGAQLSHRFASNAWLLDAHVVGSVVRGDPAAITYIEQLNRHLFQRPDATDVHLDPNATSLAGLGATWQFGRLGEVKHLRVGIGGDLRTPGLELNDVGFQTSSDRVGQYVWAQWRDDDPGEALLNWQANADVFFVNNFEPLLLVYGVDANTSMQTADYWSMWTSVTFTSPGWDPVAMRGGPRLRSDAAGHWNFGITTDTRKKLRLDLGGNINRVPASDEMDGSAWLGATIQARSNLDLFVGPSIALRDDPMQYVTQTVDDALRTHYIFASIHQTTLSMTLRANWTLSPHLSLQAYAQPFIGAGRYSELKDVDDPHAGRFADRFHLIAGNDYTLSNGTYYVSYKGAYNFAQPDFDIRSLRSTIVLRWEYRPGSTVFAIWSHGLANSDSSRYDFNRDVATLASAASEDVVLVKANYWIGL
jgi:hypothetical protein